MLKHFLASCVTSLAIVIFSVFFVLALVLAAFVNQVSITTTHAVLSAGNTVSLQIPPEILSDPNFVLDTKFISSNEVADQGFAFNFSQETLNGKWYDKPWRISLRVGDYATLYIDSGNLCAWIYDSSATPHNAILAKWY